MALTCDGSNRVSVQAMIDEINAKLNIQTMAGVMFDFGGTSAPSGSLSCDGAEVPIATYPELYSAIGDAWANTGGAASPGAGNFRVPIQEIGGKGLYARGAGEVGVGTYQADQNEAHTHTGGSHTHSGPLHTHSGPSHTHGTPAHTHSISHDHPSVNTNTDSHTHSYSAAKSATSATLGFDVWGVSETGSYTTGSDSHYHSVNVPYFTGTSGSSSAGITYSGGTQNTGSGGNGNTGSAGNVATSSSGSTEARPHSITVLKCIWTGQ